MKKGFTLIELLAVIVILAIIGVITVPMLLNVVEESRKGAFKNSVYSVFSSVEYYVVQNNLGDVPESGIDIKELNLKNNNFSSGRIVKNTDGVLIAEFVSDGEYCASGTLTNLNVNKGECEISLPGVEVVVSEKNATIILVDTYGIVGYAITESSEEPTEWITVEETTGITTTIESEYPTTYYVHVKNKYGKVSTKEYIIEERYYDEQLPTGEVQVSEKVATITLKDDKGVVGYAVTKENEEVSEWISIEETKETTVEWIASEPGNYDIHIKDKYDKINKNTFKIEQRAFGSVVTYIANGATYTETINVGSSVLAPTTFTPTKSGATFLGWSNSLTSTTVITAQEADGNPITLYAVFKYNDTTATLSNSNISKSPCYAYDIATTFYSGIDMSKYSAVSVYVSTSLRTSFRGGYWNIYLNCGGAQVGIGSPSCNWADPQVCTTASINKTVTLTFTSSSGTTSLNTTYTTSGTPGHASLSLSNFKMIGRTVVG